MVKTDNLNLQFSMWDSAMENKNSIRLVDLARFPRSNPPFPNLILFPIPIAYQLSER